MPKVGRIDLQNRAPRTNLVAVNGEARRRPSSSDCSRLSKPTHEAKKDFFPRNVLSNIINQKCVREELHKYLDLDAYNSKAIAEYARRICEETEFMENGVKKIRCFRKIFVILVLIEKTPAIIKFLDKEV